MDDLPTHVSPSPTEPPLPEDPRLIQTLRASGPERVVFGRFRLVRELGAGGMAVVWLAQDERLGIEVALKFLAGTVARDPEAVHDLQREIMRGLQLTHPGIVRVFDLHRESDDGLAAIAMEYVAGPTLAEEKARRRERCFEVGEPLLSWVRQLGEAMAFVHEEARVVHRDLKPRNIMLAPNGRIKIADFGIAATLCDSTSRLTKAPGTSGTPVYMSPQQVLAQPPTAADDIYAIGATLYEVLTSKPPFYRGGMSVIFNAVASQIPPPMHHRRLELGITGDAQIPPRWEEVIASCLAKSPADRPSSVRALLEQLFAKPKLRPRRVEVPTRRFPTGFVVAALGLAFGGVVLLQSKWAAPASHPDGKKAPDAVSPAPAVEETKATPIAATGPPPAPSVPAPVASPDRPRTDPPPPAPDSEPSGGSAGEPRNPGGGLFDQFFRDRPQASPTPAPSRAATLEAAEVRRFADDYFDAFNRRDAARIVSNYADSANYDGGMRNHKYIATDANHYLDRFAIRLHFEVEGLSVRPVASGVEAGITVRFDHVDKTGKPVRGRSLYKWTLVRAGTRIQIVKSSESVIH